MVIIDLSKERDVFLKKWAPVGTFGPNMKKSMEGDLDTLLASACKKTSDQVMKDDRDRIMRELKRLFSIDVDKVVNG